ncbi:hypothetical protein MSLAZ_1708 [Methanosarcina lacustris Z-7289]|uniref:HEPN domain-containing protein n=1 Tax=Methanosarcina lacustris Z-7289 TaxID=1434111 RepID=A0A0E3S2E9_9EURY|nr:hypothetical protein [Methanosarcina lacustris]AKB74969.1 hypothetical protein MSLAZ_1708 [Methanosarcina lacustris Z-7289]
MERKPNFNFSLNLGTERLDKQQVSYLWRFTASELKDGANRCAVERNVTRNSTDLCPIASGILLALSVELYLKYLITEKADKGIIQPINPKKFKTHNLFDLFNYLDESTQNDIIYRCFPHEEGYKQRFDELLEINACMFEQWRYLYENNECRSKETKNKVSENKGTKAKHLGFMKNLADSIESVVNSLHD